jgi:hypothetical protein
VLVAAAGVRCPDPAAEVCFEWLKLTSTGLRVSFQVTAADPGGISPPADAAMRRAMSEISVTDDTGRSYELAVEGVGWSRVRERQEQEWHGQVLLDPYPARPPGWLEFTTASGGASGRVALLPPAQVPVGTSEPPWPTPAECYLADLATVTSYSISTSGRESTAGPEDVAEIIAKVADSLLAVGALPVTSTLLREPPADRKPAWQPHLVSRWRRRAHTATRFEPGEHRGLAVGLPLEHATAMIESISAQGEMVGLQLYGHPWMWGEYWPMIAPCSRVWATDDAGNKYTGMPGDWREVTAAGLRRGPSAALAPPCLWAGRPRREQPAGPSPADVCRCSHRSARQPRGRTPLRRPGKAAPLTMASNWPAASPPYSRSVRAVPLPLHRR